MKPLKIIDSAVLDSVYRDLAEVTCDHINHGAEISPQLIMYQLITADGDQPTALPSAFVPSEVVVKLLKEPKEVRQAIVAAMLRGEHLIGGGEEQPADIIANVAEAMLPTGDLSLLIVLHTLAASYYATIPIQAGPPRKVVLDKLPGLTMVVSDGIADSNTVH